MTSGADSLEPPFVSSQDKDSSGIWSSSYGSEDNDTSRDEESRDKEWGDITPSLPRPSEEDDIEPETHTKNIQTRPAI